MQTTPAEHASSKLPPLHVLPGDFERPIPVTDRDIAHLRRDIASSNHRRLAVFAASFLSLGAALALYFSW